MAPTARTHAGGAAPLPPGDAPQNPLGLLLPSLPRLLAPCAWTPASLLPSCPSRLPGTSHTAQQPRSARPGPGPYLGQVLGAPGLAGGQQRGGPQEGVGQQLQARALALDELHLRLAQLRQVRVGLGSQVELLGPAGAKGTRRHACCPPLSTHRPREGRARLSEGTWDSHRRVFLAVDGRSLCPEEGAAPRLRPASPECGPRTSSAGPPWSRERCGSLIPPRTRVTLCTYHTRPAGDPRVTVASEKHRGPSTDDNTRRAICTSPTQG